MRPGRATGLALAGLLATLLIPLARAAAQEDPYGPTSTTSGPEPSVSCVLQVTAGPPGSTASVRVRQVPRGATVRVLFGGEQVADAQADGSGSSSRVDVDIAFEVPDVEPGTYDIVAVGAQFSVECQGPGGTSFEVTGDAEVLGAGQVRNPDGSESGRSGFGGSLPRTGVYAAALIAVALALLLVGRALVSESRRRDRRAGRVQAGSRPHRQAPRRPSRYVP